MKNVSFVELLNNMNNELEEARKEYYFYKMLQLFPEFDNKKSSFYNNYKYETWAEEASDRMRRIRKDRSTLKDLMRKYR